jgi:HlyD family secretion protein
MRIRRKHLIWIAGLLAAAALVSVLVRPAAVEVDMALAARGQLQVTIDEEGETRLRRRFAVSAPVAGRVLRIDTRPGDAVRAGQALAVVAPVRPTPLDARTRLAAEAREKAAGAALERTRSDRQRLAVEEEQAAREAARTKTLFDAGSVSRETLELADARLRTAREALKAADAAIRAAEFALAEARATLVSEGDTGTHAAVTVRSPIDGVVLRRLHESEAVLPAGAPLLEIGDLRDLEIVSDLLSIDAVRVKPGAAVVITRWGGSRDLKGLVDRVEPSGFTKVSALGVEEQRVNVVIELVDPPSERASLGDGFRVEVRIVVFDHSALLTVPTASLFRTDGRWAVFVVVGDRLARREVTIGQQNDRIAEVLTGMAEGDRVVIYPGESLADGMRVTARLVE